MAEDVVVRFRGEAAQLNRTLNQVNRSLGRIQKQGAVANRAIGRIQRTSITTASALRGLGAAFAALGLAKIVSGTVSTIASFEQLRAQLQTVMGSAEGAMAAFGQIQEFTKTTPFQLQEVTRGFITLQRMGIDTSTESLKAFGNVAAANGKSFEQLTEAVADALTGEFERLKEFGIKVRQENGKFIAAMGDAEIATADSAKGVVEALKNMGMEGGRFADGIELQAATLAGKFSNLKDNIAAFADGIGKGGLSTALKEVLDSVNAGFSNTGNLALKIGAALGATVRMVVTFGKTVIGVFKPLATIAGEVASSLYRPFREAFVAIYTTITDILDGILDYFGITFEDIGNFLYRATNGFVNSFVVFFENTKRILFNLPEVFKQVFTHIGGFIMDFTSTLGSQIGNIFTAIKNGVVAVFTEDEALDQFTNTLENKFKDFSFKDSLGLSDVLLTDAEVDAIFNVDRIEQSMNALGLSSDNSKRAFEDLGKALEGIKGPGAIYQQFLKDYNELLAAGVAEEKAMADAIANANNKIEEQKTALQKQAIALGLSVEKTKQYNKVLDEFKTKQVDIIKELQAGIAAYREHNPFEDLEDQHQKALKGLDRLRDEDAISHAKYLKTKERMEQQHAKKVSDLKIKQFEDQLRMSGVVNEEIIGVASNSMRQVEMIQQGGVQAAQGALGLIGGFLEQAGKQSKEAFEAQKAIAIAQTIISTYQAATQAFAAMSVIPVIGPALGFAAAATIVAAGLANVAAIKNQSYTGRQLGGPVQEGKSYLVGENAPEIFTPSTSGRIDRLDSMNSQPVEITFNINAVDAASVDELLIQRKGTIQQVISDAMLERGQRSQF